MRLSGYFLPTIREIPSEAEIASHRLMLRAGLIRRLAAGIYSLLPLGLKAVQKMERIIREEMDRAGAQEVFLPAMQPAEIWQKSGRWSVYGKELIRLEDRHQRMFCLGPTHEEVVTSLVANEVRSYRQLPLNLYQIQTKFRDEIRPRFGVMRGREFSMKDAYSFDRDESGAEESYRGMFEAYNRIFERCGLAFKPVEADSGPIGGSFSHEFVVLADTGEDAVMSCTGCGYAANTEKAEVPPPPEGEGSGEKPPLEKVSTPGLRTVEEVSDFLKASPSRLIKTLLYRADGEILAVLLRGDHQLNEIKLKNFLKASELEAADPQSILEATGGPVGFSGPVGLTDIRILADAQVMTLSNFITGANEEDAHLISVNLDRDFEVDVAADFKLAEGGDPCPRCGLEMELTRGIEVGHVFKLGTKYSEAMGARFLDENGQEKPMIMGCFGIGVGRTVAACIEQNHDEKGIIWPVSLAPFELLVISLKVDDEKTLDVSGELYRAMQEKGWSVLWDDRDERPGVKFKDADLVGIPLRVTVGPRSLDKGVLEVETRRTGEVLEIPLEGASEAVDDLLRALQ
jgi:prolyl-tRNA synthetase